MVLRHQPKTSGNLPSALACSASDARHTRASLRKREFRGTRKTPMAQLITTALIAWTAGFIAAWLVQSARTRLALAQSESRALTALSAESQRRAAAEANAARVPVMEAAIAERDLALFELKAELAALDARSKAERGSLEEKLAIVDDARIKLTDAFKALSADALKSNNQSFLELARTTLESVHQGARGDLEARQMAVDQLVRPLRESLQAVDMKLGDIEKARLSAYTDLSTQLRSLVETHLPMLRSETANLVKALRQPTVRGRWGEIQLKRVVEMAGMLDHCDFIEQESRSTEDGRFRPDLIVRLPGGKQIVVDSKAPVEAYLRAAEAQDEEAQRQHLADHARQVRAHMSALGRKAYFEQFDPTPEFVVLFLPGEMFFSAALQQDPALIEFGVNERVIPATPTTLIALLRAVAYGWRQEALAKNAQEVADLGKRLYERIAKLGEHWVNVGDRLGKAVDAYNSATTTLETRVLVSARRFQELGAGTEGVEVEAVAAIERVPRRLQAGELLAAANESIEQHVAQGCGKLIST
jgi:DNA recombination protein RmuC